MGSHGRILSGDFLGWDILMIMWRTVAWREHDQKQESYWQGLVKMQDWGEGVASWLLNKLNRRILSDTDMLQCILYLSSGWEHFGRVKTSCAPVYLVSSESSPSSLSIPRSEATSYWVSKQRQLPLSPCHTCSLMLENPLGQGLKIRCLHNL